MSDFQVDVVDEEGNTYKMFASEIFVNFDETFASISDEKRERLKNKDGYVRI